ncbi:MAG: sulfatase-like hydrolase/transferase [Alphaproteobacteria bacterium]|nr:sulfatase-like hydrolase/transferase [Alphaproteobacteria bacterium]MCB9792202.1 sulfatase-like hydrolase/transferase [Alphaproteobacteria bacterium]
MRALSLLVGLQAACSSSPTPPPEPAQRPPNVLLITMDTTRADRLGPYGYKLAQTPTLDRLAAEGATFERHATTAPITLPAHISILSGLRPPTHGVRDNGAYALSDAVTTLPERLAAQGYEARAWVSAVVLDARYNLDQGFVSYDDALWTEDAPPLFMIRDRPGPRTAERVVSWLAERDATPAAERAPFFAWMHLFDAHQPWETKGRNALMAPSPYDAEIATADEAVGMVIAALEAQGELDDTLVIVTADHGESLGEHGEQTHGVFIYDATMHVPLLMRWPGHVPPGLRVEQPSSAVDIVPTVLSMLGLPPAETEGVDLSPTLSGGALPARDLYMESLLSERGFGMAPLHGLRRADEVWIRAPRPERYDLRADPGQLRDLHAQDPAPGEALDAALQALLDESASRAVTAESSPMSTETREMLMAMGYLSPEAERSAAAGMDPKDGLPLRNLLEDARGALRQQRYDEGVAKLTELLEVTPDNVSALNTLAYTYREQGKLPEARALYERSLQVDPQQYRVLAQLGRVALDEGNLEAARQHLEASLSITPDFVEAMVSLGVIAYQAGDEAGAEAWHQKALAVDPDSARLWRDLADLRYRQRRWDEAIGLYQKVIEANPQDFQAWLHAGAASLRSGQLDEALRYTKQAQALRPDSWLPLYNIACAEVARGEEDAAIAHLREAADKGLRSPRQLLGDSDLEPLRDHPGWAGLLEAVKVQAAPAAHPER